MLFHSTSLSDARVAYQSYPFHCRHLVFPTTNRGPPTKPSGVNEVSTVQGIHILAMKKDNRCKHSINTTTTRVWMLSFRSANGAQEEEQNGKFVCSIK